MVSTRSSRFGQGRVLLALVPAILIILSAGCGKKAPPFLPEPVPAGRLELGGVLLEDGKATFSVRIPGERFSKGKEEEPWVLARILRSEGAGGDDHYVERTAEMEPAGFPFGQWRTMVDEKLEAGRSYRYKIEVRKRKSKEWAVTEPLEVATRDLPPPPKSFRVEGREGAVALSWQIPARMPPDLGFDLYRRGEGQEKFEPINRDPVTGGSYTDVEVGRGREYCYRLRTVLHEKGVETVGRFSETLCASSVDRTPPPSPSGLVLVFRDNGFVLTWLPAEAVDLGGYNVYRAAGKGPFTRVNAKPLEGTSYFDGDLERGVEYGYRVTAVDRAIPVNESPFSDAIGGTAPAR